MLDRAQYHAMALELGLALEARGADHDAEVPAPARYLDLGAFDRILDRFCNGIGHRALECREMNRHREVYTPAQRAMVRREGNATMTA